MFNKKYFQFKTQSSFVSQIFKMPSSRTKYSRFGNEMNHGFRIVGPVSNIFNTIGYWKKFGTEMTVEK